MFDVLIRKGTVVDGSGKPGFVTDLGVEGDRITLLGAANGASAKVEIDAAGKIVCPGIVDSHSHADLSLHREDHAKLLEPLVRQGITTFIGGNCGMSLAPLGDSHPEAVRQYIEVFTNFDVNKECPWKTMGEFFDTLDRRGLLLNAAILAPHGLLRLNAMGMERRYATDDEIKAMARELDQALEEGAIGLSTGLQYFPGSQSDTRELLQLGQILKKHDGMFASHLRSYSKTLAQAIDEVIQVSRENGIRSQISHLFWIPDYGPLGPAVRAVLRGLIKLSAWWTPPIPLEGFIAQRLGQIDQARAQGVQVGVDAMPTTTGFTHALAFFPPWALEGSRDQVIARLRDPQVRTKMLHAIEHGKMTWPHVENDSWSLNLFRLMGWECCRIMAVSSQKNKRYEGISLVDIAAERGKHPFDTICDLLIEEEGHVLIFESMGEPEDSLTERSTFASMKHPEVAISTDTILMGMGRPSHLFYGAYPKFLGRYVREQKIISLETAVRKMTGLPAEHFHLKDRGTLRQGAYADILLFDPSLIATRASFKEPSQYPEGIEHVFINGAHVVDHDTFNPNLKSGRLLRNK